ncbi:MAG: hypothetical protein BWY69_00760 [Planctomycetes bacterium ADurb.Bin401]|nr:MAG: hypothetical protein BWY69_00760 [Planctomycetes bacterium ADurb.Bin401]
MSNKPQLIIRMGSHAEKEYIMKLNHKVFDGIVIGANVVEATAGATASLIGKKLNLPYYIDPMTYVFGCDLDGIKSEQKKMIQGKKKTVRDYKRSYLGLADELGYVFVNALKTDTCIQPDIFNPATIKRTCQNVIEYQRNRIVEEFKKDEEYEEYADAIKPPAGIFSPYFYVNNRRSFELFLELAHATTIIETNLPVYSVLCADVNSLNDESFIEKVLEEVPKTGIYGVWLWFSKFDEFESNMKTLRNFKNLVHGLSKNGLAVFNRHGGYFSMVLNKLGMTGISHGIGYGEKKDVFQIEGPPNAPVVQYYLPDLFKRFGIDNIERCFDELGVTKPQHFHNSICDCVICKGVIKNNISEFREFGETHYARLESKRETQTPAAAKRSRFHFLMNRIKEKNFINKSNLKEIIEKMQESQEKWEDLDSVIHFNYLDNWINSLN